MTQIIERLMPETELNLETLKDYVHRMERSGLGDHQTPGSDALVNVTDPLLSPGDETEVVVPNHEAAVISEEIGTVHSQVGRLRVDSKGVERKSCQICELILFVS
jgi:hypothetical protein